MDKNQTKLKTVDFINFFFRSLFIQATWNYERMLSLGYCFCFQPFVKKYLQDKTARTNFLKRNLTYFNTHPYMANCIIGAAVNLEIKALQNQDVDVVQTNRFKKRLSSSLGALGDQIFWNQVRPICAMIGVLMVIYFQWLGLIAFLLLYNVPHLYVRIYGFKMGYQKGFEVVSHFTLKKYQPIIRSLSKIGGIITGILLVLAGTSNYMSVYYDVIAFSVSIVLMIGLIKLNFSIPVALMILVVFSSVVGALIM